VGDASYDLESQNDQRRAGRKRRSQETRAYNGRVPEWSSSQSDIKKRRDGVDRDSPNDGDKDEGNVEPRSGATSDITEIKEVTENVNIEKQIPVQDDYVPTEHRAREVELTDTGDQMPKAIRSTEVNRYESQTHEDGRHSQQFTENNKVVQFLVIINIH